MTNHSSRRGTIATAVVLALAVAACSSTSGAPSPSTSVAPVQTQEAPGLQGVLDRFVGDGDGGAVVFQRRGGEVTTLAAGAADATGTPLEADSLFRVGSISKPFIAVMVLQMSDEGRVDLDAPLGEYLPSAPVGATVTVRELLSHRSGLPDYTEQPELFVTMLADPDRRFEPSEVLGFVEAVPPGPAGLTFSYSNTNYILLGLLVEHISGTDLAAALETRITGPLGLTSTYFPSPDRDPLPGLAGGWSPGLMDGQPGEIPAAIESGAWAAGALVSSAGDLAAFLEALAGGRLMSDAGLAAMTDTADDGYGFGILEVYLGPGQIGYGHNGAIFGFTSTMAIAPGSGDTLVILTNNDRLIADELAFRIVREL